MFYVKRKIAKGTTIQIELRPRNIFTKCLGCGKEIEVDLSTLGEFCYFSTHIYCSVCSEAKVWMKE
jgi:hypothetical protein